MSEKQQRVTVKEFFRRRVVALKRNPSVIPLLALVVAFLVYSLNLTLVSNSTAKIQGSGMGICEFGTTLFSILSMVCMLNAFPRRKKANVPMLVLLFLMLGLIAFCDVHYLGCISAALTRAESPIQITDATSYIPKAQAMLHTHIVLILVSAALVALLPVYSKMLKKINTSVAVEDNGDMDKLELSE